MAIVVAALICGAFDAGLTIGRREADKLRRRWDDAETRASRLRYELTMSEYRHERDARKLSRFERARGTGGRFVKREAAE
jgi:hypothetical protein